MKMPIRRAYTIALIVACAITTRGANAQKVRISQSGGRLTVTNGLPARIAALVIAYGKQGAEDYATIVVDANSTADVQVRNANPYVLSRIEALHKRVGATGSAQLTCDTRMAANTLPLRADSLRATLERLRLEGTPEAEQELDAATQLVQVELQQHLDELKLKSLQYAALRQNDTSSSWQDTQRRNKEDSDQQREQLVGQMAYTAFAHDEEVQAKLSLLTRQADAMQKVAEQADAAMQLIDGMYRGARVEAAAGAALDALVRREMPDMSAKNAGSLEDVAAPTRACNTAGMVGDWIRVHATAERERSIAFVLAEFDNGDRDVVPARRISVSDDWIARLYWPPEAHRVTLTFADSTGHKTSHRLDLGHASLRDASDAARKRLEDVKKNYKNARYRAEGADQIKTIVIP